MPDWLLSSSEVAKNLAQGLAVLGAGVFFLWRWYRGWISSNLSLSSSVTRVPVPGSNTKENVVVTLTLAKGGRARALLDSVCVQAFDLSQPSREAQRFDIDVEHPSGGRNIVLPPGETAHFDAYFVVDSCSVMRFDSTVSAFGPGWKTSLISLPSGPKPDSDDPAA